MNTTPASDTFKAESDEENIPCDHCGQGRKPLYRIIDICPRGEEIDWAGKCEECGGREDRTTDAPDCDICDSKPYQPENRLNLTIAVVDGKLMFEDKHKPYRGYGEWKRFIDINFCPMCGM